MATKHDLKLDPDQFRLLSNRLVKFNIRNNDRNFQVGDTAVFHETAHSAEQMAKGEPLVYTGEFLTTTISHVVREIDNAYGITLAPNHVILSLEF